MVYKYFNIIIWFHKILLTFGCWPYAGRGRGVMIYSTFDNMIKLEKLLYGTFPKWFCWQSRGYVTLGIDPLLGKRFKGYVAGSSPCIGHISWLTSQNASIHLACGLEFFCTVQTLVYLQVDMFGGSLVCNRLRCAPAWAALGYSFVGCSLYRGCITLLLRGLFCVSWVVLHCPPWLFCVAPSWAVLWSSFVAALIPCRLCCNVILWARSAVRFSRWRKGFQHSRFSLLTAGIFAGKRFGDTKSILF